MQQPPALAPARRGQALSPAQVRALLKAANWQRDEALYVVAVHTGLRQGELLELRWADVDLDAGRLSVRHSLKVTEDGLFSWMEVECLGYCDLAPCLQVNFDYHEKVTTESVDKLIDGLK